MRRCGCRRRSRRPGPRAGPAPRPAAVLQRAGDARQPRAEAEGLHLVAGSRDELREAQRRLGMRLHRAGDVDQQQQPARLVGRALRNSRSVSPAVRRASRAVRASDAAAARGGQIGAAPDRRQQAESRLIWLSMARSAPLCRLKLRRLRMSVCRCVLAGCVAVEHVAHSLPVHRAAWLAAPAPRPAMPGSAEGTSSANQALKTASKIARSSGEPASVTRPARDRSARLRIGATRAA